MPPRQPAASAARTPLSGAKVKAAKPKPATAAAPAARKSVNPAVAVSTGGNGNHLDTKHSIPPSAATVTTAGTTTAVFNTATSGASAIATPRKAIGAKPVVRRTPIALATAKRSTARPAATTTTAAVVATPAPGLVRRVSSKAGPQALNRFDTLPDVLLLHVWAHVLGSASEVCALACVCVRFSQFYDTNSQRIWHPHFIRTFPKLCAEDDYPLATPAAPLTAPSVLAITSADARSYRARYRTAVRELRLSKLKLRAHAFTPTEHHRTACALGLTYQFKINTRVFATAASRSGTAARASGNATVTPNEPLARLDRSSLADSDELSVGVSIAPNTAADQTFFDSSIGQSLPSVDSGTAAAASRSAFGPLGGNKQRSGAAGNAIVSVIASSSQLSDSRVVCTWTLDRTGYGRQQQQPAWELMGVSSDGRVRLWQTIGTIAGYGDSVPPTASAPAKKGGGGGGGGGARRTGDSKAAANTKTAAPVAVAATAATAAAPAAAAAAAVGKTESKVKPAAKPKTKIAARGKIATPPVAVPSGFEQFGIGLVVGQWTADGSIAFVECTVPHTGVLHAYGLSPRHYSIPDDVDSQYGLHSYSVRMGVRTQTQALWSYTFQSDAKLIPPTAQASSEHGMGGGFASATKRAVHASGSPSHDAHAHARFRLSNFSPDSKSGSSFGGGGGHANAAGTGVSGPLALDWCAGVLLGRVHNAVYVDVAVWDERDSLIWSVGRVCSLAEDDSTAASPVFSIHDRVLPHRLQLSHPGVGLIGMQFLSPPAPPIVDSMSKHASSASAAAAASGGRFGTDRDGDGQLALTKPVLQTISLDLCSVFVDKLFQTNYQHVVFRR